MGLDQYGRLAVSLLSPGVNALYVVGYPGGSSKELSRFSGKTFTEAMVSNNVGPITIYVNGAVVATVSETGSAVQLPTPGLTFLPTDEVVFKSNVTASGTYTASVTIGPDQTLPALPPSRMSYVTNLTFKNNYSHTFYESNPIRLNSSGDVIDESSADNTSSDIKRFFATEVPLAKEAKRTHLMLKLLSPGTVMFFLKLLIF